MGEPKTVRVRIAVVVDFAANWSAAGWGGPDMRDDDYDTESMNEAGSHLAYEGGRYWIEADVPAPVAPVIQGSTTPATPNDNAAED